MFHLVQGAKLVEGSPPTANGHSGDYICVRDCGMVYVIVHMNQDNAAQATITIEKATADGVGNTAITTVVPIYSNLDCADSDTMVARTAAVNYQLDAGIKNKIVVFQIDPRTLGNTSGTPYDWIRAVVGTSNASNVSNILYLLTEIRYKSTTPPTVIA